MAKTPKPKPSFLDNFSLDNISSDDIGKGDLKTPEEIKETTVKPVEKATPKPNVKKQNESKDIVPLSERSLDYFFEKNYTTSNATRTTVDASVIAIIDKVTNATPKLYSVNLVSNILANWIEEHRNEIEKHLKDSSKI